MEFDDYSEELSLILKILILKVLTVMIFTGCEWQDTFMNRQICSALAKPSGEAQLCGIHSKDKVKETLHSLLF